jgi:hypothetical protein
MQVKHLSLLLGTSAVVAATLGWLRSPPEPSDTPPASALDSVVAQVHRLGPPVAGAAVRGPLDARAAFLRRHGEEIENTFSVAGAVLADSIALGLIRYRIGRSVYHDVRWLRRVGGAWYPADPPVSVSADTGMTTDSLAPVAARWLKEGDPRWW